MTLTIDGSRSLSADAVTALEAVCDRAEDQGPAGVMRIVVSGAPNGSWTRNLGVALVSKWERALRRLERLPVTTVALAAGDCGGMALDALLATDYRVATTTVRLLVPVEDGSTWPGMALYRLAQQAGVARIRRAALFGRPIEAAEALDLNLVHELTENLDSALATAPELAVARPDLAIRRRLLLDAATTSFEEALGAHLAACDRLLRRTVSGVLS